MVTWVGGGITVYVGKELGVMIWVYISIYCMDFIEGLLMVLWGWDIQLKRALLGHNFSYNNGGLCGIKIGIKICEMFAYPFYFSSSPCFGCDR